MFLICLKNFLIMELDIDFPINFPVNLFSLYYKAFFIMIAIFLYLKLSTIYLFKSNFIMLGFGEISELRFAGPLFLAELRLFPLSSKYKK